MATTSSSRPPAPWLVESVTLGFSVPCTPIASVCTDLSLPPETRVPLHCNAMTEPCPYCLTDVRVTRWDQFFNLATRCPRCGLHSGPRWTGAALAWTILASVFLNGLVFFTVARPLRALALLAIEAVAVAGLLAAAGATHNDHFAETAGLFLLLAPAVGVVSEFYWHDAALSRGARVVVAPAAAHLTREQLRNELEIAIHHGTDALALGAKLTYAFVLLTAALDASESDWLAVIAALLIAGCIRSATSHESKPFAVAAMVVAGTWLCRGFASFLRPGGEWRAIEAPLVFLCGAMGITLLLIRLAHLRALRAQIPLPPAEHLRDAP